MRRLTVFALLAGALAMPAAAQRGGGGHGGGFGGGHAGGGGGFHGGFSGSPGVSHSFSGSSSRGGSFSGGYRGQPGFNPRVGSPYAARYPGYGAGRSPYAAGALRGASRLSAARPTFYSRFGNGATAGRPGLGRSPYRGHPGFLPRYGYGYGYGYPGLYSNFVGWNFLDLDPFDWDSFGWNPNTDGSNSAPYADASAAPYAPAPGYDNGAQPQAPPQGYAPQGYAPQDDAPQPSPAPQQPSESAFTRPSPLGPVGAFNPAPPRSEDLITIVFKDGRAPVHARNYALTRDAILLTSPRLHEIPLDQVDLPATERINHAAGIDFALPRAQ